MLLKQKRFVNSKIGKLVELYEKEKDNKLTVAEASVLKIVKTKAKISIGKAAERYAKHMDKKYTKAYKKYDDRFSELDKMFDNNEISKEQYDKEIEKAEYKLDKVEYELDMEDTDKKPKNPMWKNIKETISKGLTSTRDFFVRAGQGIKGMFKKVPLMLGTGAKVALKTGYKGAKHTIKGVKKLGNGFKFVGAKISEVTKDIREEADREMEEKASAKQEKAMFDRAARQQVDAIKNKNPRESLGMQHFEINHEEAIKKSEEKSGEEKEPEQLENN